MGVTRGSPFCSFDVGVSKQLVDTSPPKNTANEYKNVPGILSRQLLLFYHTCMHDMHVSMIIEDDAMVALILVLASAG